MGSFYEPPNGPFWKFDLGSFPEEDAICNKWKNYAQEILIPLFWYWSNLAFPGCESSLGRHPVGAKFSDGITWHELAIDFEMATRVRLVRPAVGPLTPLAVRADIFSRASRSLFRILGLPSLPHCRSRSLRGFGSSWLGGLPSRPVLFHSIDVFVELSHQAMNHCNKLRDGVLSTYWTWPPLYRRLPTPSWRGLTVAPLPPKPTRRLRCKTRL